MDGTNPTTDGPIDLPPLDAGANENYSPYQDIPDEEDIPTQEEDRSNKAEETEESNEVADALKKQMASESGEDDSVKEDSKEDREEKPKEEKKPAELADFDITDDDLDRALDSIDNFRSLVGKVEARVQRNFNERLYQFAGDISTHVEKMIYLNEATKECPEILVYQDAFRVAYNKACKDAKDGDLRAPVFKAVEILRSEIGKLDALKSGNKIDVRSKKAPKQPSGAGRQAQAARKSDDHDGISFLETLL